jgi:signal transduction histidine kinase/ligand-binding sensor domain-containing protein
LRSSNISRNLLLAVFAMARIACGLDPERAMSQYIRRQWGSGQGFPGGQVYSIAQTPDGYLWAGSEAGLVRFDGLTFHLIPNANQEAPEDNQVFGLASGNDGNLWVRLRGLNILRFGDGRFLDVFPDLPQPDHPGATAMIRSKDGGLILATRKNGVIVMRGTKSESLASISSLPRSPVISLAEMPDGEIWLGTREAGLIRLRGREMQIITKGLPDLKVNCLLPVRGGADQATEGLWIGTDHGLARWNGREIVGFAAPSLPRGAEVLAMTEDRDSNIWVGTASKGLFRINSHGITSPNESDGVLHEAITALFEDREANLWVGGSGGLERFGDSPFVTYSVSEGLPADGGNPVFVDSENRMWFAPVSGGLWWVKGDRHGHLSDAGLDKDVVYSIAGGNSELWLGRQRGGLTQLSSHGGPFAAGTRGVRTWKQADGLAQDSVYSVYRTRDGTVWAGTLTGGASRLSKGRFRSYTTTDGLVSNTVSSILESADATMWFATPNGLSALSNGHWQSWTAKNGLPSDDIDCLLEDSRGLLWAGTATGLAFRKGNDFRSPPAAPAALREQIMGLAEDKSGSLWMATSRHVLRVNRDKLLRGALTEQDIREFGFADGLRSVEGVKRHRSVITDSLGRIWFSLNRGISVVDPARLTVHSIPASIRVQTVSADGSAVDLSGSVHIPGGRKRIIFGFTSVSLSVPERIRFRYRLDEFDRDWSEPVTERAASYTNLPPGSYRFRVIASNPDGLWSANEAVIGLTVDPLFRQTWWFGGAVFLTLAITAGGVWRLRLLQITKRLNVRFEERLAERTRIAQELHDTLLQGFLSASMQVYVAAERLPADSVVKPPLNRALQLMRQVIDEGRDAVRGLRSAHSESLDLELALSRIQEELPRVDQSVGQTGAKIDFRVIVEGARRPLHPVPRDEVYRIGREALINAFRHAQARSVSVELTYSSRALRLLVRDDGRGIDQKVVDSGRDGHWGLAGMRERANRMGARLRVFSSPATGTEIELSVPAHIAFQGQPTRAPRWFANRPPKRRNANK